ncbi:MAG TPA: malto-oligosyltrehalose trehalohydrolase [Nocardioidaceae bacterium]|nr:malto-oligosyltrehalose trehalohydrolase [Nocardioidaceae bacterium]
MTTREFSVWAPGRASVALETDGGTVPMDRGTHGWWRATAPADPGDRYGFRLDEGPARPDPRGLRLPDGPHGLSAVFDVTEHDWQDRQWRGTRLEGAVIYELHVGTFTPDGTLDSAVERLDHLVDLGVTLVELLPLAPTPGLRNWGYDGVAPQAVDEVYGGPAALQRFVDAAHARGLGVCLDVVYNHLGPEGNYLTEFGPYLTDRYTTPWGAALNLDGPGSDEVRRWISDNAVQWFRDFHVDALRLDAVHELIDNRAVHVLEELSSRVDDLASELGRPLTLIAESDRNDPRTVTARADGGFGLHGQWSDDIHHALHVALTGEAQGYYADFAAPEALPKVLVTPFFHDGTWSSFRGRSHGRQVDLARTPPHRYVASLQTHDQVGNRATGDRLSHLLDPGRLACGAALLLTAPWTPMLFMGEEWGAGTPWQFFTDHTDPEIAAATSEGRRREFSEHGWSDDVPDPQEASTFERSRLDWSEVERDPHRRLLGWYRDLIRLRREHPELLGDHVQVDHDPARRTVVVRREGLAVLVNLADEPRCLPVTGTVLLAWEGIRRSSEGMELPGASAAVVAL